MSPRATIKLYGISSLGADKRVFKYLSLDYALIPIDWIAPLKQERIEDYATRLGQQIPTQEKFDLLGASFGGLIAVEISKKSNPDLTILISNPESKSKLRMGYRLFDKSSLLQFLPSKLFQAP